MQNLCMVWNYSGEQNAFPLWTFISYHQLSSAISVFTIYCILLYHLEQHSWNGEPSDPSTMNQQEHWGNLAWFVVGVVVVVDVVVVIFFFVCWAMGPMLSIMTIYKVLLLLVLHCERPRQLIALACIGIVPRPRPDFWLHNSTLVCIPACCWLKYIHSGARLLLGT